MFTMYLLVLVISYNLSYGLLKTGRISVVCNAYCYLLEFQFPSIAY